MAFREDISVPGPVLVDFWAPWCGPCRAMMPAVEELSKTYKVVKVNIDEDEGRETSVQYQINAVPTLIVFKDGKPVKRLVGIQPKAKIESALKEAEAE